MYLALLACRLNEKETEQLNEYLHFPKTIAGILRDTSKLKTSLADLDDPPPSPGLIYRIFQGFSLTAINTVRLAGDSPDIREYAGQYLDKLRYVKIALTGHDLIELGIPPGPRIKEIQAILLEARLNGIIKSKKDEIETVKGIIAGS
jgi:hypothetical protein